MAIKFRFTFPEMENLNDIVIDTYTINNNELTFTTPSFYKPVNKNNFKGWIIDEVWGDLLLLYTDKILTKNNNFRFSVKGLDLNQSYEVIIVCRAQWDQAVELGIYWGSIDGENGNPETAETTAILGQAILGNMILGG